MEAIMELIGPTTEFGDATDHANGEHGLCRAKKVLRSRLPLRGFTGPRFPFRGFCGNRRTAQLSQRLPHTPNSMDIGIWSANDLGSRWCRTSAGYPQGNGMNETIHRTLEKSIAVRVQGREGLPFWKLLGEATFAYNTGAQAFHGRGGEESRQQSQYFSRQPELKWATPSSTI
eukprot:GHVS01012045.1.p1 GENE.GHVS01012045.1~~GHVS01012045.1.p1  ORF type:complete len:173 (+),score=7.77 GHVS01012045.1:348-866(+)